MHASIVRIISEASVTCSLDRTSSGVHTSGGSWP